MRFSSIIPKVLTVLLAAFLPACAASATAPDSLSWPGVVPRSPDVAALEKYVWQPVSHATGTLNVEVPLFRIPLAPGAGLDLSLSYHASGVRVNDLPGCAGTGWALNAGGCISREIRGQRDETMHSGFYRFIKAHPGHTFPERIDLLSDSALIDSIDRGIVDPEPDLFCLTLPGRSLHFFLGSDGEFHTIPQSDIRIDSSPLGSLNGTGTWRVTDGHGNRWIFGGPGATETSYDQRQRPYPTAWKLTSVLSSSGQVLATLSYTETETSPPGYYRNVYRAENPALYLCLASSAKSDLDSHFGLRTIHAQEVFLTRRLSSIHVPGLGDVTLRWMKEPNKYSCQLVDSIRLTGVTGSTAWYALSYQGTAWRPFLKDITRGGTGAPTETYRSFGYYPGLPLQHSYAQDLWGFYNGKDNHSLFADSWGHIDNGIDNNADRRVGEAPWTGSLKTVQLPAGGRTEITYGHNMTWTTDTALHAVSMRDSVRADTIGTAYGAPFRVCEYSRTNATLTFAVPGHGRWEADFTLENATEGTVVFSGSASGIRNSNDLLPSFYTAENYPVFSYATSAEVPAGWYVWKVTLRWTDLPGDVSWLYPASVSYTYYGNSATGQRHEAVTGGIRVEKVAVYDADSSLVEERQYNYLRDNGQSSGVSAPAPEFKRGLIEEVMLNDPGVLTLVRFYTGVDEYHEDNISRYRGSAAYYTQVTEETRTPVDTFLTVYRYTLPEIQAATQLTPLWVDPTAVPYLTEECAGSLPAGMTAMERTADGADRPLLKKTTAHSIERTGPGVHALTAVSLVNLFDRGGDEHGWDSRIQLSTYPLTSMRVLPVRERAMELFYREGGGTPDSLVTVTVTEYGNPGHVSPTAREVFMESDSAAARRLRTEWRYACDFPSDPGCAAMLERNIISVPVETRESRLSGTVTRKDTYGVFAISGAGGNDTIVAPSLTRTWRGSSPAAGRTLRYLHYDRRGNPLEAVLNGSARRMWLWSYAGRLPVAEIEPGGTAESAVRSAVSSVLGATPGELSLQEVPDTAALRSGALQAALPGCLVTTLTHDPAGGMSSLTAPSSETSAWTYDGLGRLTASYVPDTEHQGQGAPAPVLSAAYSYHANPSGGTPAHVRSSVMLTGDGTSHTDTYGYADGLGRVTRTLGTGSGTQAGIETRTSYAGADRVWREWLPAPEGAAPETWYGDTAPYTEHAYRASSAGWETARTGPGQAWSAAGRAVWTERLANTAQAGDSLRCLRYAVNAAGTALTCAGAWPAGSLRVERVEDEDGHAALTFTDMTGKTVLTRRKEGARWLDTYYVYDGYGDLRCVLPPAASAALTYGTWTTATDPDIQAFAYLYDYDERGRLTAKKLPGCAVIRYVYDPLDRAAFSQDGAQRAGDRWTFRLYDAFGRPAVEGETVSASTPAVTASSQDSVWYTGTGSLGGYASQMPAALQAAAALRTVTYYDDHLFIGHEEAAVRPALGFSSVPGYGFPHTSHRGRMTGQRTYRLSGAGYTVTSLYGDARGRTVRRSSTNHLGGVETTATAYSHTGKPIMERHTHTAQGKPSVTEVTSRTYDGWDRPVTVRHSLGGAAFVTVDSIAYDGIGRVASETTGGVETATYTYNVRSWPTKIAGQRFTERLCYNGPVEGLDTSRPHRYRWNGTVAACAWKTAGETRQRGYSLMYDGLDRLTAAYYGEGAALGSYYSIYDGRAAYDDMGNPVWIYRKSPHTVSGTAKPSSPADRLRLEYDGNRLVHVTDSVTSGHSYAGAFHFADEASQSVEYEYDDNGNMTKDLNRGITGITYNALNLPSVIQFGDNSYIEYTYGADGQKLRTQYGVQPGLGPLTPADAGGSILAGETAGTDAVETVPPTDELNRVDYCGNMVYDRGERRLLLENGYVTFDLQTNTPSYHFYLRDHLGNNRVVMAHNGTVEQVTHYYPFGGVMRESTNPGLQPYKYGGKELDRTSGLDAYDFGARMYFADRLQWGQMDPLCEKYYDASPYNYCVNNPVRYIDPDGRDGMITGQGTKDDPYVITAVYFYQRGSLNSDQISGLNAAIADYNKVGGDKGIVLKVDGVKSYAKFNLSAEEVEDLQEARKKTCFETIGGSPRYYGSFVGTEVYNGKEYGSADNSTINFNISNINDAVKDGLDRTSLNKGVAIHEIGHNLGGEHSDGSSTMRNLVSETNGNGIIKRHDSPKLTRTDGRLWKKK